MTSAAPWPQPPPADPASGAAASLRVLFVEDDPDDVELEVRALRGAGIECAWDRVDTAEDFVARLSDGHDYDVVVSDYRLPIFDGLSALRLLRERRPDLPFILVSGALGEEAAIETLKLGATDYVLKDHLERLAPVVRRALHDAEERRQRERAEAALRDSEARYRSLVDGAPDVILTLGADDTFTSLNPAFEHVLGHRCADWIDRSYAELLRAEDLPAAAAALARVRRGEAVRGAAVRLRHASGGERIVELTLSPDGRPENEGRILGVARDITTRARAEARTRALIEIGKELSGARDLQQTLGAVCPRIAEVTPCDIVLIVGDAAGGRVGHVIAQCGLAADVLAMARDRRFDQRGPYSTALRQGTLILHRAAGVGPSPALELAGIERAVVAAVHWQGRYFGGLVLAQRADVAFDADQVAFAEALAHQIGAALDAADLRNAEREEGEVAGALARIGQDLISSIDLPVLLDLLCRITTDVLQCEVAYTLLYREEEEVFVPVANFGYSPERWEVVRALRVPRRLVAGLAEPIERDNILHATADDAARANPELVTLYDVREILAIGLRRGGQLVGVHVAAQRTPGRTFGPRQYRIATGLAQLASLALENARLFEKLEGANQLKAVFLATMSHELRTPLNVIIGYTELLLDEVFGRLTPEQTASLDRVGTSARELLELISATLDISRLETGRAALTLQEIRPAALLREIEDETAAVRDKPGVASVWEVPDDLPTVYSDAVKLKVLLKNLINNAYKFTDAGSVTVRAAARQNGLELRVTDTGIGMTPAVQAIIFEPFRQGDGSSTRRHGGVGLGLYIVSRLLDMLGGHIEVESAPGAGSTFRVWVPRDALRPAQLAPPANPLTPPAAG
ncbi:PAS domain S-box protein [bacterium]|nr:PAS domain S-box protein [bacterium]